MLSGALNSHSSMFVSGGGACTNWNAACESPASPKLYRICGRQGSVRNQGDWVIVMVCCMRPGIQALGLLLTGMLVSERNLKYEQGWRKYGANHSFAGLVHRSPVQPQHNAKNMQRNSRLHTFRPFPLIAGYSPGPPNCTFSKERRGS